MKVLLIEIYKYSIIFDIILSEHVHLMRGSPSVTLMDFLSEINFLREMILKFVGH